MVLKARQTSSVPDGREGGKEGRKEGDRATMDQILVRRQNRKERRDLLSSCVEKQFRNPIGSSCSNSSRYNRNVWLSTCGRGRRSGQVMGPSA